MKNIEENIININGINFSVKNRVIEKSAKNIIFIHGMFQTKNCWRKQFESKELDSYNLFSFDLRGHGDSDKPKSLKEYLDSRKWADDLHEFIRYYNITKPYIVAWSYGGYVVNDFLKYYSQDFFSGIIYVDAALKLDKSFDLIGKGLLDNVPDIISKNEQRVKKGLFNFINNCYYNKLVQKELDSLFKENIKTPIYVRKALVARELNYEDIIQKITIPVLFVYGKYDSIILPKMSIYGSSLVKNSSVVEFENSAHTPFIEEYQRFNLMLKEFID